MYDTEDTIAAISTPLGRGGIGIVRLSGEDARSILRALFSPPPGRTDRPFRSHELRHGWVRDPESGAVIDEVLAVYMRAPNTYTREDVVEVNCHGGPLPVRRVLECCLRCGARLAEPGEMTLRAFLNGRIDLAQAEAVADVIGSRTDAALRAAVGQLSGSLSSRIATVRAMLLASLAHLEATLDFAEEDLPPVDLSGGLRSAASELKHLLATGKVGAIYRDGVRVAIVGKPNVGKSSLLNSLLGRDRAIVTGIPGTTRDTLEEGIDLRGVPVYLIDTAGIAEARDAVEQLGIERSRQAIEGSDLSLLVLDGSGPLMPEDEGVARTIRPRPDTGRAAAVIVVNKADLPGAFDDAEAACLVSGAAVVRTSTITGDGLDDLEGAIVEAVLSGQALPGADPLVTNSRHYTFLQDASRAIDAAVEAVGAGVTDDLVAIDVREAIDALGMITGESIGEDILEQIFSRFCVGK